MERTEIEYAQLKLGTDSEDELQRHLKQYYHWRYGKPISVVVANNLLNEPVFRVVTFANDVTVSLCQGFDGRWFRNERSF